MNSKYKIEYKIVNDVRIRYIEEINYWCLTDTAKAHNKEASHWYENKASKDFLTSLSSVLGIPRTKRNQGFQALICTFQGSNWEDIQGTWGHEEVFIEFAGWCNVAFRIQANRWVRDIMTGKTVSLQPMSNAQQALKAAQALVDLENAQILLKVQQEAQARLIEEQKQTTTLLTEEVNQIKSKQLEAQVDLTSLPESNVPPPEERLENLLSKNISTAAHLCGWTYSDAWYKFDDLCLTHQFVGNNYKGFDLKARMNNNYKAHIKWQKSKESLLEAEPNIKNKEIVEVLGKYPKLKSRPEILKEAQILEEAYSLSIKWLSKLKGSSKSA